MMAFIAISWSATASIVAESRVFGSSPARNSAKPPASRISLRIVILPW